MKHIKTKIIFEQIKIDNYEYVIDNYIKNALKYIIFTHDFYDSNYNASNEIFRFHKNNIGVVVENNNNKYNIVYFDVPDSLSKYFKTSSIDGIKVYMTTLSMIHLKGRFIESDTIDGLKQLIKAREFNI